MRAVDRRSNGFTLIELITVVILVGILSVLGGMLITAPIQGFVDISRRAQLVDITDNALQRISREVRHALPNSVRIHDNSPRVALEFLHTSTGGRYRARPDSPGGGNPLDNTNADTFDVLGDIGAAVNTGPAGQANCMAAGGADCLVIYNTGTGGGDFNAYEGDNIAALTQMIAGPPVQLRFENTSGWTFPFPIPPSESQRFYVVDYPVSYVCDLSSGELRRYEDYGIVPNPSLPPPGAGRLLADRITACDFDYLAGGPSGARHGLVTLRMTVSDSGESVTLMYQVHVVNMP